MHYVPISKQSTHMKVFIIAKIHKLNRGYIQNYTWEVKIFGINVISNGPK